MESGLLLDLVNRFALNRLKRRRWLRAAACMSAAVIFIIACALIVPAVTMEKHGLILEADTKSAQTGQRLTVIASASSENDRDRVFYIASYGDNAGLIGMGFDNDRAYVQLDNGELLTVFREVIAGGTGYWFSLPAGSGTISISLDCVNGIGQLLASDSSSDTGRNTVSDADEESSVKYLDTWGDTDEGGTLNLIPGSGDTLDEARTAAEGDKGLTLSWDRDSSSGTKDSVSAEMSRAEVFEINTVTTKSRPILSVSSFLNRAAPTDLTEHITSIVLERAENGEWVPVDIPGGTLVNGDLLRLSINFTFEEGISQNDSRTVTYQLKGIGVSSEEQGTVKHGDSEAGTYVISKDGLVTIDFNEEFADGQAFSGYLQFQCTVTASGESGDDIVDFGYAGGTVTVVPDMTKTDLSISKSAYYDSDDTGKIIYSITVSSEQGSRGSIDITDVFLHDPSTAAINYDGTSFSVNKLKADGSLGDPVSVSDWGIETQTDSSAASFYIRDLPALGAGESYVIFYTATPDLSRCAADGSLKFSNKATASDDYRSVDSTADTVIFRSLVAKTGSYDSITGKTLWKITLNPDGRDIGGMTLSDVINYTVEGQTGSFSMELPEEVTVTVYEGQTWKGGYTVSLPYTFPQGSVYTYVISYETDPPEQVQAGKTVTLTNKAFLDEFEAEYTVDFKNPGEQGYNVVKLAWKFEESNTLSRVKWYSAISYPAGASAAELTYVDWILPLAYSENNVFIQDTHYTTLEMLTESFQITGYLNYLPLVWDQDYDLYVVTQSDFPEYTDVWTAYNVLQYSSFDTITEYAGWHKVTAEDLEGRGTLDTGEPLAAFKIVFKDTVIDSLKGDTALIAYDTCLDMNNIPVDTKLFGTNAARIVAKTTCYIFEDTVEAKLNKQASAAGLSEDITNLGTYTDEDLSVNLYESEGLLHYRLLLYRVAGETGDIIVRDVLPQGAEFVPDSVRLIVHTDPYDDDSDYTWEVPAEQLGQFLDVRTEQDASGETTVTFTLRNYSALSATDIVGIYYDISVAGDSWDGIDEKSYTNTAYWGSVHDEVSATVNDSLPLLEKTGEQVTDTATGEKTDGVRYYVLINRERQDLVPGSNFIELRDELTIPKGCDAHLRVNSVALYHYDPANEAGHYCGGRIENSVITEYDEENYIINFTLPDSTACVLVYEYTVDSGTAAGDLQISNLATLSGQASVGSEYDIVLEQQTSSAGVNKASVTIYKYGGTDYTNLLSDAKFALERFEAYEGVYTWTQTSLTADDPDTGYFISDESGTIVLNFVTENSGGASSGSLYHTLYRLVEKEAPAGYAPDGKKYYFVWLKEGETEQEAITEMLDEGRIPENELSVEEIVFIPYSNSHTLYVSNEPTRLTVRKEWRDGNNLPADPPSDTVSVTVQLWQHVKASDTKIEYGSPVTLSAENEWQYTWSDLPRETSEGEEYFYTVEEINVPEGFRVYYSPSNYMQISAGEIAVFNQRTFILPDTGGRGTLCYILAGSLLTAAGTGCIILRRRKYKKA